MSDDTETTGCVGWMMKTLDNGFVPWIPWFIMTGLQQSWFHEHIWVGGALGTAIIVAIQLFLYQRYAFFLKQPAPDPALVLSRDEYGMTCCGSTWKPVRIFPKVFDILTFFFLAGLTVVCAAERDWAKRYSQMLSSAPITVIFWITVLINHPFTTDYARDKTPELSWDTPPFKQVNLEITIILACGFTASSGSSSVCAIDDNCSDMKTLLFSWVLPLFFGVGAGVLGLFLYPKHRGKRIIEQYKAEQLALRSLASDAGDGQGPRGDVNYGAVDQEPHVEHV